MSQVEENQIEYKCPLCQHAGRAYRFADDGPSMLRVLIRCQHCMHRWSAIIARTVTK